MSLENRMKKMNKILKRHFEILEKMEDKPETLLKIIEKIINRKTKDYMKGYKRVYFDIYIAYVSRGMNKKIDITDLTKRLKRYYLFQHYLETECEVYFEDDYFEEFKYFHDQPEVRAPDNCDTIENYYKEFLK